MTSTDDPDGMQTRRTWMIDEFRHAQQRRQARTSKGAVEPVKNTGTTGNADAPAGGGAVVIISS